MTTRLKVFVCFSTANRDLAKRLFDDLSRAGAETFQFEESAEPGSNAWHQVLDAIRNADWFVALLTNEAMTRRPVLKEIEYAFYCHVNEGRPELLPAAIETISAMPNELEMFTELPFRNYDEALDRLTRRLGLAPEPATAQAGVQQGPAESGVRPRLARKLLHAPEAIDRITCSLASDPAQPRLGQRSRWIAEIRNDGTSTLTNVVAQIGPFPPDEPFSLAPGELKKIHRRQLWLRDGTFSHDLVVTASAPSGKTIRGTASATTRVQPSGTTNLPLLKQYGVGDNQFRQKLADSSALLTPIKLPIKSVSNSTHQQSSTPSQSRELGPVLMLVSVFTLVSAIANFMLTGFVVGLIPDDLPGWLESPLDWLADAGWLQWLLAILFFVAALLAGLLAAEANDLDEEIFDYAMACAIATGITALLSLIWGVLFSSGVSDAAIRVMAAALAVTGQIGVAAYAAIKHFDSTDEA